MIVSDATTLIVLDSLNRFDLLKVFNKVYIPKNVFEEVSIKAKSKLEFNYEIIAQKDELYNDLLSLLDKGEAEAIALAKAKNMPLIIDEKKGRSVAKRLGLIYIGFLGLLCKNIRENTISKEEALEVLQKAISNGFRVSNRVIDEFKSSC